MLREVAVEPGLAAWRDAARALLRDDVEPGVVAWRAAGDAQRSLLDAAAAPGPATPSDELRVPAAFLRLAESVVHHRDVAGRSDALFRLLWRLTHGEPALLDVATDPDVHRVLLMDRAVGRAVHKLHAFVRFRAVGATAAPNEVATGAPPVYVAWFEPPHPVLERAVPLFVRRFPNMRWSVLTPDACAHWDGERLAFGPGVSRDAAPDDDALEELWRSYYAHVFNPARLATGTMRAEMPKRYWANLPEARLIPELAREAPRRVARMLAQALGPAEPIPAELAAGVGAVRAAPPTREIRAELDEPGAWDPVHDPGATAARERARRALHAPTAALLGAVPVRLGVAGWTDRTLTAPGVFYPDEARTPEARLRHYASRFPLVEVDATYYTPPSRESAVRWGERTPDGFVFDVKAYALMTGHAADVKRMPDWLRRLLPPSLASAGRVYAKDLPVAVVDEVWARFLAALEPLREAGKLGAVLLQFPPWFEPTRESAAQLAAARERLGGVPGAVELRCASWMEGRLGARTVALLERLGLAYVMVDAPPGTRSSMPPAVHVTAPLAVVRLHGRRTATWESGATVAERYRYLYDRSELAEWVGRVEDAAARLDGAGSGVHVVFNNCHANYGTTNATELAALLLGDRGAEG